jgi:hypothetical protein
LQGRHFVGLFSNDYLQHESVGTLMLSRLSLASTCTASSTDDSSECATHCACLDNPPFSAAMKQTLGIESYLSVYSDDEIDAVIKVENWTTIKRVPSLVRNRISIAEEMEQLKRGRVNLPMLDIKVPVKESEDLNSNNDRLYGKQHTAIPSLVKINSLHSGIQSTNSLTRGETAT